MKTKALFLVLFATLILSVAAVSALTLSGDSAITIATSDASKTVSITGDELFNVTSTSLPAINGTTFALATANGLNTTSATITITPTFPSTFTFGSRATGTLTVAAYNASNASSTASRTVAVTIENNNKCTVNNPGSLTINDIELNVVDGLGDDEDYWYPLDDVEVGFTVENAGNSDVKDIEITACLRDLTANKCIMDEDDMEISKDSFDLDSGDDLDVTLKFNIDPDILKAGNTNYRIYIAANGEVDDSDVSYDGNSTCITGNQNIEIVTDDSFVVIPEKSIVFQETAGCGSDVEVTFDLWNVGDEDIDSDELFLQIYNSELKIKKIIEITEDLDSLSKQELSAVLSIPANATAKTYSIEFAVFDDDSMGDNDVYESAEEDKAKYYGLLKVDSCVVPVSAAITADFSSETPKAIIGNQVVIESTVKNTGTASAEYKIELAGYTAWSTLSEIDPETFTLAPGDSKKVSIYLDISSNAEEGAKEFTIQAKSGTSVVNQKVSVNLEKGFSGQALVNHFKKNWFIYVIVLVNLILILAIIFAVRSIMRKN